MNGALLGLAVVLVIGFILGAFLFAGGKLIDFALARGLIRKTTGC